jgi:hypothetical protein
MPADAPSLVGPVAYHDHLALLCSIDAEWTRRRLMPDEAGDPMECAAIRRSFTEACYQYADGIEDNYQNFLDANAHHSAAPGSADGSTVAGHLYRPAFFVPLGHADDLAIVLLDDFAPVHYLVGTTNTTVEDAMLAFCPTLQSMGFDGKSGSLRDLGQLLCGDRPGADGQVVAPAHEFQRDTPLLVYTQFKMDGLAALGQGLLFQQTLMKVMARKIEESLQLLRDRIASHEIPAELMSLEDVDSLRCCFLDLQGADEIGTLMFCRNYSVATTLVVALRSLTFDDAFKADPRLESALQCTQSHRAIIRMSQQLRQEKPTGDLDVLHSNHVFRWTNTTLAVSSRAFHDRAHCNGYIAATCELQVLPGHEREVEATVVTCDPSARVYPHRSGYVRYPMGRSDSAAAYGRDRSSDPPLVHIQDVLPMVWANVNRFGRRQRPKDHGRDIVDLVTHVTVPVPRVTVDRVAADHFSPVSNALLKLQERLCMPAKAFKGRPKPPRAGGMDLDLLKQTPRLYGVPVSLRWTLEYIYQNYAILTADPFLFDVVLDLYDTFATLHAVLTRHLPAARRRQLNRKPDQWLGALDAGRVEQLAMLAQAIQNAMVHRMANAYPEARLRDMAVDFRGGLNQLVMAADVPVKCGMGLVRLHAHPSGKRLDRDRLAAPTCIGFNPGARCVSLHLGTEDQARLGYCEVDVPHVTHVASYLDFLHETFHMAFDAVTSAETPTSNALRMPLDHPMADRIREVFALLMIRLWVFPEDPRSFVYHHVITFCKSLTITGTDPAEAIAQAGELLIRLFLASDAVGQMEKPWTQREWAGAGRSPEGAQDQFDQFMRSASGALPDYERWWRQDDSLGREYCRKQFQWIYREMAPHMPDIWRWATHISTRYAKQALEDAQGNWRFDPQVVSQSIQTCLREGRPFIRGLYLQPAGALPDAELPDEPGPDALWVCLRGLSEYVCRVVDAQKRGCAIHLQRDPATNAVIYPPDPSGRPWFEFQADKGAASMFCPVPWARRQRLRRQIVLLKSLWDISSALRARRLREIVSYNWEDDPQTQA